MIEEEEYVYNDKFPSFVPHHTFHFYPTAYFHNLLPFDIQLTVEVMQCLIIKSSLFEYHVLVCRMVEAWKNVTASARDRMLCCPVSAWKTPKLTLSTK